MASGTLFVVSHPASTRTRIPRATRAVLAAIALALAVAFSATALAGCSDATEADAPGASTTFDIARVPAYTGAPAIVVNDNEPAFTDDEMAEAEAAVDENDGFERYSPLDRLGRCGVACACIGPENRPTEERSDISSIHPTGWNQEFYEFIEDPGDGEGEALYNRCHLIAFSLSGENDNELNLITGTHYLNVEGMLPYENQINRYIDRTGNHVLYRVAPVFAGDELLARGVSMEALSVEDGGAGVRFSVYCYNVQPGVTIDYATGANRETPDRAIADGASAASGDAVDGTSAADTAASDDAVGTYVLNENSMRFHRPDCSSVPSISSGNRADCEGSRRTLIDAGYEPCGACNP